MFYYTGHSFYLYYYPNLCNRNEVNYCISWGYPDLEFVALHQFGDSIKLVKYLLTLNRIALGFF